VNTAVARDPGETPTTEGPVGWLSRFFSPNNRYLPPLFITCILLAGQLEFGILESWGRTLLAIATSMAMEIVLARLIIGKWPHLASAYITGISVGILVRSPFLWPYALCSFLSILSKYVIRWRGRHLWNPSNFGVSSMLFLYPVAVASLSIQWGNALWPMVTVWCIGSIIIFRLRRFHICASYVGTFLLLSWIRSEVTGNPWLSAVAPLTGPMYQLFVFFMITDPRTTVRGWRSQCMVASLVAVAEMVLRLNGVVDAPYYALFLVGPVANAVDIAIATRSAPRS
jgi:Na+-translocating ferredoxin:NAD+ oxidoreductase RnfD subunit